MKNSLLLSCFLFLFSTVFGCATGFLIDDSKKATSYQSIKREVFMWTKIKHINRINLIILIIFVILVVPLVSHSNPYNRSLERSAMSGYSEKITYYIERGADVNSADKGGRTILMVALEGARRAEKRAIITKEGFRRAKERARREEERDRGTEEGARRAEERARRAKNRERAEENAKKKGYQHKAYKYIETIRILLAHGADVNAKDQNGLVAIHKAAMVNNTEIMEILLAHGADVNAKSTSGLTPIIMATGYGLPDIVRVLINNGADVNLGISSDKNALMHAKRNYSNKKTVDRAAIIELLIAAGAKPIKVKEKKLIAKKTSKAPKIKTSTRSKDNKKKGPYIEAIVKFDKYDRAESMILKNINGKEVAKKVMEFQSFNPFLIAKKTIIDSNSDKSILTIPYNEYGKPLNNKWLCLDKNGNMVMRKGKPVFIKTFHAIQRMESRIAYSGSFKTGKNIKIFPCDNCAKETGLKSCVYVW